MCCATTQVQAAMEGAASAANSRSTSHAASRAQSPDLHVSEHAPAHSPTASLHHISQLHNSSSLGLQNEHAILMQQQLPATGHAADTDISPVASQPSSTHSSPAISKQRPFSASTPSASAAEASPTSVATTAAAPLLPEEASAAESDQADSAPVQESPRSDAMPLKRSHDRISYEKAIKEADTSSSGNMLRQSGSLGHGVSKRLSPDIQQMQRALYIPSPEPATYPQEVSEAHGSPQSSALHHTVSLLSDDGQSSCSDEHSLKAETVASASVSSEASCKSDSVNSSAASVCNTTAERHTDTVGVPAVATGINLQSGSSPPSAHSRSRHSLDGNSSPLGGDAGAAAMLHTQAPVDTSRGVEDTGSTTHTNRLPPQAASSSVAVLEADAVPSLKPAQLSLPSHMRQPEPVLLQDAVEHSEELDSPLSQTHASQLGSSQSGGSSQLASSKTEQSSTGNIGTSPSSRGSASSVVGLPAVGQQAQREMRLSSNPQVCKHDNRARGRSPPLTPFPPLPPPPFLNAAIPPTAVSGWTLQASPNTVA